MTLDAADVHVESAAWVWVPDDAREVRTPEFWLVAYPAHFSEPTMVFHLTTSRAPEELVGDVLQAASALGRDSVAFVVSPATLPPSLEPVLAERGELCETLSVLARDLADVPDLDVPDDVELRRVVDVATVSDAGRVATSVFGGTLRTPEQLEKAVTRLRPTDPQWVAYRGGVPVGTAGLAVVDGVARLWGGSVLPEAQHTGVYRALLAKRLDHAREAGCRMALVKGRVETSAPVLGRAGFTWFGEERAYRLAVP